MAQHMIVTMFEVFLVLLAAVLLVARGSVAKGLWKHWGKRATSAEVRSAKVKSLCAQAQQQPGGT
jgi:hypothetical protein